MCCGRVTDRETVCGARPHAQLIKSTQLNKPVIALTDSDASRGGLSREQIYTRLLEAEASYDKWESDAAATPAGPALFEHLFAHDSIEWNRFGNFQVRRHRLTDLRCELSRLTAS